MAREKKREERKICRNCESAARDVEWRLRCLDPDSARYMAILFENESCEKFAKRKR